MYASHHRYLLDPPISLPTPFLNICEIEFEKVVAVFVVIGGIGKTPYRRCFLLQNDMQKYRKNIHISAEPNRTKMYIIVRDHGGCL